MEPGCFACHPEPNTGREARGLCAEHKGACKLSDGASLYETLAQAEPPGGELEGSALGWLYNPVFVIDERGVHCRAWTSFAAGGMAVLEDRFAAADAFEFWMCEREDMVGLLADLAVRDAVGELQTALKGLKSSAFQALSVAAQMWLWHRDVRTRSDALGHWPRSFEELAGVLTGPGSRVAMDVADTAVLLESLRRLSIRRFPGRRAPA